MGFKNDNALKQKLEQKGSGGLPIVRVTNDNSPLTVRFLTAPTEWLTTPSAPSSWRRVTTRRRASVSPSAGSPT